MNDWISEVSYLAEIMAYRELDLVDHCRNVRVYLDWKGKRREGERVIAYRTVC